MNRKKRESILVNNEEKTFGHDFLEDDVHVECLMQELNSYVDGLYHEAAEKSLGLKKVINQLMNKKIQEEVTDVETINTLPSIQELYTYLEHLKAKSDELENDKYGLEDQIESLKDEIRLKDQELERLHQENLGLNEKYSEAKRAYLEDHGHSDSSQRIQRLFESGFFNDKSEDLTHEKFEESLKIILEETLLAFKKLDSYKKDNNESLILIVQDLAQMVKQLKTENGELFLKLKDAKKQKSELTIQNKNAFLFLRPVFQFLKNMTEESHQIELTEQMTHNLQYLLQRITEAENSSYLSQSIHFGNLPYGKGTVGSTMIFSNLGKSNLSFQNELDLSEIQDHRVVGDSFVSQQNHDFKEDLETMDNLRNDLSFTKQYLLAELSKMEEEEDAYRFAEIKLLNESIIQEEQVEFEETQSLEKSRSRKENNLINNSNDHDMSKRSKGRVISTTASRNYVVTEFENEEEEENVPRKRGFTAGLISFFASGIEALSHGNHGQDSYGMDPNEL